MIIPRKAPLFPCAARLPAGIRIYAVRRCLMEPAENTDRRPILALMYDFDHTLSPRDMQEYAFIPELGMEGDDFWALCREVEKRYNMDGILAYMYVMIREGKKRGMKLDRGTFNRQGARVELFNGVDTWFDRVNAHGEQLGFKVEHYILSSGQKEIIEGTPIADKFKMIYAAEYVYSEETGEPEWAAMAVNYTSKTQFIYRINKGILDVTDNKRLNEHTPHDMRRVPYTNMIYIGDGTTDIPCMKLVSTRGGHSIAAYTGERNQTVNDMLIHGRVQFVAPTDYSAGSEMEQIVFSIFDSVAAESRNIALNRKQLDEAMGGRG